MALLGFSLRLWAVHKDSSLELSVCSVPEVFLLLRDSSWLFTVLWEVVWHQLSLQIRGFTGAALLHIFHPAVLGGSCWSPVLTEVDDEHLVAQLEELCARALAGDAGFPPDSFTRTGIQPFLVPSIFQDAFEELCLGNHTLQFIVYFLFLNPHHPKYLFPLLHLFFIPSLSSTLSKPGFPYAFSL